MNERQRYGVFTVVPALIGLAPVYLPLYARFHPRPPQWLEGDGFFAEVLDSLFLWPLLGSLYLVFVWSQPESAIPKVRKRLLVTGLSILSVIGLLHVAPGVIDLYRDAFGW